MSTPVLSRAAVLSPDGAYRYSLIREFAPLDPTIDRGRVCFQLCNPSTADANRDDPTVRKGIGFALRWGYSSIEFVNRGAFRATDPRELLRAADPIGPYNFEHVHIAFERADLIVFAWGNAWPRKLDHLSPPLPVPAFCLGQTSGAAPKHPLMLGYATPLVRFAAATANR